MLRQDAPKGHVIPYTHLPGLDILRWTAFCNVLHSIHIAQGPPHSVVGRQGPSDVCRSNTCCIITSVASSHKLTG